MQQLATVPLGGSDCKALPDNGFDPRSEHSLAWASNLCLGLDRDWRAHEISGVAELALATNLFLTPVNAL